MEQHIVKVLKTEYLTHNVKRFVLKKPAGYNYIPGQATDVAINKPGWKTELRPFTFTSLHNSDHLEFMIKIYTGHNGVTEQLAAVNPGDELIIHEVFGAINYKGPGVFIAGGAGITPFVAILRQLKADNKLAGNTLLFANRTEDDIILKDELDALLGKNCHHIIDHPLDSTIPGRYIDGRLLEQHLSKTAYYYICGPDKFIEKMIGYLEDLGVTPEQIVIEQ